MQPIITFIGAGNMSKSLIGGLLAENYPTDKIIAADLSEQTCKKVQEEFGIRCTTDNQSAIKSAEVIVLAVKPQVLKPVCQALQPDLVAANNPLIISVAAGIKIDSIQKWLGNLPIVRSMPNTPALVQAGATGLFANSLVSESQQQIADQILSAGGITVWVEQETELDAVTALSGSGPAYFFLMIEAMQQAGVELGLSPATAQKLSLQTAFGAAKMAINSDLAVSELRQNVTSPNGTTEQAIKSLQSDNLDKILLKAMQQAKNRAEELAKEFDN